MSKALKAAASGQQARQETPYERFRNQVERLRPEIAALVGKELVDRYVRVCLNAVQANAAILDADRRSLLLACVRAAQDGLLPDGREAVFNIYRTKVKVNGRDEWRPIAQYLPMVGGMVKKLYESGQVKLVDGVAVNEKDRFEYERGDNPRIVHVPYSGDEDPGKIVAAYVVARLANGEVKREVMFRRDIERAREASSAQNSPAWAEWYDQQAIKTVLKRAYKQLPSTPEFERAVHADDVAAGFKADERDAPRALEEIMDDVTIPTPTAGQQREPVGARTGGAGEQQGQQQKGADPQAGTPAMATKYEQKMADCKDREVLDLVYDETRGLKWNDELLARLSKAYTTRCKELQDEADKAK